MLEKIRQSPIVKKLGEYDWAIKTVQTYKLLYRRYLSDRREVEKFLDENRGLSYNTREKCFEIADGNLPWDQKIAIRYAVKGKLKNISPAITIRLDQIETGYYDKCLERYLFQRINLKMKNEDTCWFKYAQNNKCIGWHDPGIPFDKKDFILQLSKLPQLGKLKVDIESLERRQDGFVFCRSDIVFTADDGILSLCEKIRQKGFSNALSLLSPLVLGYSTTVKKYNVISGRHRIAVLKYLYSQGEISGSLKIRCHLVKYPFDSLVFTRPYSESCRKCISEG